jgi:hypothetical protein
MRNGQVRQAEGSGGGRDSSRPTGERSRIMGEGTPTEAAFSDLINRWFEEGERLSGSLPCVAE